MILGILAKTIVIIVIVMEIALTKTAETTTVHCSGLFHDALTIFQPMNKLLIFYT